MSTKRLTSVTSPETSQFEKQMRSAGIIMMSCDGEGELHASSQHDWCIDLLLASPLLQRAVVAQVSDWVSQDIPVLSEAFTGVWLAPVRQSQSRRNSGFAIGVIITESLCDGEYFHALCQASGADATVIRELIQSNSPVARHDAHRLATLFQIAWNARVNEDSNQSTIESFGQELADSYEEISCCTR